MLQDKLINTLHKELSTEDENRYKQLLYQHQKGLHLSKSDIRELKRLNHLVMETVTNIHNTYS